MQGSLTAAPFQLDLGPTVACAGFEVLDHQAVIAELGGFEAPGLPVSAVAKRRAEFLAGRFAARQALAALGVDGAAGRNQDGSPRWPAQAVGSITHGAGRALCAVARVADVRSLGIDAERLMSEDAKRELLARICGEDERALLSRSLDAAEHHLVTFAFSTKESLYKCLYPLVGHFMDFRAARVVAAIGQIDGALLTGELTLELSVDWSTEFRRGQQLQARFVATEHHVESAVLLSA